MILYMQELWLDIIESIRQYRTVVLMLILFAIGIALGVVSVDSQCTIIDTSSGQYIVLIVTDGSAISIFIRLLVDCCVLVVLLWLLSLRCIANYCKLALPMYLGYNVGVCIVTTALLYGFFVTLGLTIAYLLYMLVLLVAINMSYCNCSSVYGCNGTLDCRSGIVYNVHSILVVFGAIFTILLLIFVLIRPIFAVI